MIRQCSLARWVPIVAAILVLGATQPSEVKAGGLLRRRTPATAPAPQPTGYVSKWEGAPPLGTFYGTPYVTIRGNYPTGFGGYSPLDQYGDTAMSMYGPMSAFRSVAAPVRVYSRGYDGRAVVTEGHAFSTPNLPALSPVIYPTQGTYFYGFPTSSTPPWRKAGTNWIDQN